MKSIKNTFDNHILPIIISLVVGLIAYKLSLAFGVK